MPTASPFVVGRFVTTGLKFVVLPLISPAVKESVALLLVAVALADSVMLFLSAVTVVIVVPAAMPGPVTTMPAIRLAVEVRPVTTALSIVVLPVMRPAAKENVFVPNGAVGASDSVISEADLIDSIVVPAGMPSPETVMPGARFAVEWRPLTCVEETLVVPAMEMAPEM